MNVCDRATVVVGSIDGRGEAGILAPKQCIQLVKVNDRRGEQRQHLRNQQTTDDRPDMAGLADDVRSRGKAEVQFERPEVC